MILSQEFLVQLITLEKNYYWKAISSCEKKFPFTLETAPNWIRMYYDFHLGIASFTSLVMVFGWTKKCSICHQNRIGGIHLVFTFRNKRLQAYKMLLSLLF